jgi:hypothetical protein
VTVELADTGFSALVAVNVRVEQDLEARLQPARFELVRWLPNPNNQPATSEEDSSSSTSSGSSSSSTGTSPSSAGGNP